MNNNRLTTAWYCRVCGLNQNYIHWDVDKQLPPTYDFCDCCNAQFGYNDSNNIAISIYRKRWIDSGAEWSNRTRRMEEWNLKEQLKNIPDEYRDNFVLSLISEK